MIKQSQYWQKIFNNGSESRLEVNRYPTARLPSVENSTVGNASGRTAFLRHISDHMMSNTVLFTVLIRHFTQKVQFGDLITAQRCSLYIRNAHKYRQTVTNPPNSKHSQSRGYRVWTKSSPSCGYATGTERIGLLEDTQVNGTAITCVD